MPPLFRVIANIFAVALMGPCVTLADGPSVDESHKLNEQLNVISWRLKSGVRSLDFDRIAGVLAGGDISLLQNIEFRDKGESSFMIVARVLEKRTGEKICVGWFKNARGQRGHDALIWRDRLFGFVEKNGEMKANCTGGPLVLRNQAGQESANATFFLKSNNKLFILTSVSLESPVPLNYSETGWGLVVAGDLGPAPKGTVLSEAKKWKLSSAIAPSRTGGRQDNFWYKNLSLVTASPINLFELFPDVPATELYSNISDSFPIQARFSFSEKEAEAMQMQLIVKKKTDGPDSPEESDATPLPAPYPGPVKDTQLSNLSEDIEGEAGAIETQTADAKMKKRSANSKKSK